MSPSAFARAPANEAAFRLVEAWPDWPGPVVCIAGSAYCGKSHLAMMWTERSTAKAIDLATLSAADFSDGLAGPLWIDRQDGDLFDEDALFHLINLAREEDGHVLLTTRMPPAKWDVGLPDLASRLKALPVVQIEAPNEALLEAILVKRMADMGLDPDPAMVRYVLARLDRTYEAIHLFVEALGRRNLAAQRRATLPLAAEVLEEITDPQ